MKEGRVFIHLQFILTSNVFNEKTTTMAEATECRNEQDTRFEKFVESQSLYKKKVSLQMCNTFFFFPVA